MAESSDIKTLEAKCHCGSVHFTLDVPKAELPLRTHLCHCALCRYFLGTFCIFHATLRKGLAPKFIAPSSEANMTEYCWNADVNGGAKFCSTCGCHIAAIDGVRGGVWVMATSIFLDHGPDNFDISTHTFSKCAKDRGLANFLTHIDGRELGDWNPSEGDPRGRIIENEAEIGTAGEERLRAKCHCGGVSFTIPRPTQEVLDDPFTAAFVSPSDKTKWSACVDACDDCRLVTGTHVIGWTFFPLALCEPAIGPDLLIGTSKTYASSPGVLRSFCGKCGATLFFSCDERRPEGGMQVVDLATGVLRAPEGALAENWLTWRARMAWLDSGKRYDKGFAEGLQDGLNKYVMARDGKIDDYNIG